MHWKTLSSDTREESRGSTRTPSLHLDKGGRNCQVTSLKFWSLSFPGKALSSPGRALSFQGKSWLISGNFSLSWWLDVLATCQAAIHLLLGELDCGLQEPAWAQNLVLPISGACVWLLIAACDSAGTKAGTFMAATPISTVAIFSDWSGFFFPLYLPLFSADGHLRSWTIKSNHMYRGI